MRISKEQMDAMADAMADAYFAIPREAPTIEERRAALKVGQVITDPALLAKGMRVVCNGLEYELGVREEAKGCWHVSNKPGVAFGDFGVRNGPCPLTFLGWAQEEKAGEIRYTTTSHALGCTAWPCVCGAKPVEAVAETLGGNAGSTCMKCYWQGGVDEPHTCAEPQPSPPPRGLPFVYLEWCSQKAQHDGKAMCLTCEGLIAEREACRFVMESPPQRPEPHRPSDTGMGGTCGPVMGRLR